MQGNQDILDSLLRPRTFAALMAVYESNYRRLVRLAPCLQARPGHWVSHVEGALDLHLRVREQHRYTTVIELTYYFAQEEAVVAEPAAEVYVYHDAGQAEVTACSRRHRPRPSDPVATRGPEVFQWRWEMNRFLNKWLGYCLLQGHSFHQGADSPMVQGPPSLAPTP